VPTGLDDQELNVISFILLAKAISAPASNTSPAAVRARVLPFDVLRGGFAILFRHIPQQCSKGLALPLLLQGAGNVARNRIGASGSNFPVDSHQLILGQTDGNFRIGRAASYRW
jgi:hypothetical protein